MAIEEKGVSMRKKTKLKRNLQKLLAKELNKQNSWRAMKTPSKSSVIWVLPVTKDVSIWVGRPRDSEEFSVFCLALGVGYSSLNTIDIQEAKVMGIRYIIEKLGRGRLR